MTRRLTRCAIYTRKSTEEGLDQDFNSLDAQRDACEAYVLSQKGLGWSAVATRYDDGGYSGGSMDRPALKALLKDIKHHRVDLVVVYKVDRLTRSLADFAKLVEVLDAQDVSFVSVTQQFNTSTSMGRLTLNVLLSFAQFEREVTAERIRDKIAASKRKGMWMGGLTPLGYNSRDKQLVVNQEEAETVRTLFRLYLEWGTVADVLREANKLALRTKRRTQANGQVIGNKPFTRGHLYQLLSNPVYIGDVRHKSQRYPGNHDPIIERRTFDAVRAQMEANAAPRQSRTNAKMGGGLAGRLFDEAGDCLYTTYAHKKGARYRYYVSKHLVRGSDKTSSGWRLPAHQIEKIVVDAVRELLLDDHRLSDLLLPNARQGNNISECLERASAIAADDYQIYSLVRRVTIKPGEIVIELEEVALLRLLLDDGFPATLHQVRLVVPVVLKRRGVETKLVLRSNSCQSAAVDDDLLKLLGQAHLWFTKLKEGHAKSGRALALDLNVDPADFGRTIQLLFLAPDIAEAILEGRQPVELTPRKLKRIGALPLGWSDQRRLLGFVSH